jgi:hypothetical protein
MTPFSAGTRVVEAANQYARQLLLACETLITGAALKKAAAAPKCESASA